jgi:tRNA-splicing ligase RtcB (3'-phosphate/5'-hydroxy nucleic acid ligase)
MKVINKDEYKVPVFSWCENIEESAMVQIDHLAKLPFVHKRVCIMPDCHAGYGMPIGGVIATDGVIIPNAVGLDIGCGMCAVKTSLAELDTETLKKIMWKIREVIPVGFEHNKEKQDESLMPNDEIHPIGSMPIKEQEYNSALKQLGTLGGGNHFIEIQKGSDGFI